MTVVLCIRMNFITEHKYQLLILEKILTKIVQFRSDPKNWQKASYRTLIIITFWNPPKSIEIQNFKPKTIGLTYVVKEIRVLPWDVSPAKTQINLGICMKKPQVLFYTFGAQGGLWSDCFDVPTDLSLHSAHQ